MTKIRPFKATIYNQEKILDLSNVTCPPYDVISPEQQKFYHHLDAYNFIRIILGLDVEGEDSYKRAGKLFNDWQKEKILIDDQDEAIYFYNHQYNLKGEKKCRLGFLALLRLQNKNSSVFGHENTRDEAKQDRFKLLKQVKANLSPIFVIFKDQNRIIQRIDEKYLKDASIINITDNEKGVHKLWKINDKTVIERIVSSMQDEDIFIADGHHRYEVACAYRDEVKKESGALKDDDKHNYIMAYFTNTDARGLTILPIHRLVKVDEKFDLGSFKEKLKENFDVEQVKDKRRFFFLIEKAGGATEHVLGMYKNNKYWLLRLKNPRILDKLILEKSAKYRQLDVAVLNYLILNKILGLPLEDNRNITFSACAEELIEKVDNHSGYLAFFLNPVKIEQIMSVALGGEKMPAKSTYFYPKVLSGLTINKL